MNNDPNNMNEKNVNNEVKAPDLEVKPESSSPGIPLIHNEPTHLNIGPMDPNTPRVDFQTSFGPTGDKTTTPPPTTPSTTPTTNNQPAEKSTTIPLIMVILVLIGGAYFIFSSFNIGNMFNKNTSGSTTYTENEEGEQQAEKKKPTTKEEEKTETEETTKTEEAASEASTSPEGGSTPETPTADAKTFESGTVLYLYVGGSIGMDGVSFAYVSHEEGKLTTDIIINDQKKQYTFTLGQETKVDGLKNPLVIGTEKDYYSITFK